MELNSKILVAGASGMVGSAIVRNLRNKGYTNILTPSSSQLDLKYQKNVQNYFEEKKPEYVFLAAAKVGGIHANNTYRADFIYENIMIQSNVIHQSYIYGIKKLLFLGSSCIYPKISEQPIKEEFLLSGKLESTNEPYAIAKIAGIKMCDAYRHQYGCNFISIMPTNLYGPNDNFDLESSHVMPALIRKFHEAKAMKKSFVEIWGSGEPYREFLHVDDMAEACYIMMIKYDDYGFLNAGYGKDIKISELSYLIAETVGYTGKINFDLSKPDGTKKKLIDSSKLFNLGFTPRIDLKNGIINSYEYFISKYYNS